MIALALVLAAAWQITSTPDSMTDQVRVTLSKRGEGGLLVISCQAKDPTSLQVQIGADAFAGYKFVYARPLTYRFDQEAAVEESWASVNSSAMLTTAQSASAFLTRLLQAKLLRVRMIDAANQPHELSFDVADFRPAAQELIRRCHFN